MKMMDEIRRYMKCEVCGEKLQEWNEYGLVIHNGSCEHWVFRGDIYPHLWTTDERMQLRIEQEIGMAIVIGRAQGGFWLWEMTQDHPEFEARCKEFERRCKEEGLPL